MNNHLNEKVIVRGDRSGVFFGTLTAKEGMEVELSNSRRLWYWEGASSISQIANDGTKKPEACKFSQFVSSISILDAIEIIPCTEQAAKVIEGVAIWQK